MLNEVRVLDGEARWGDEGCSGCKGRGWNLYAYEAEEYPGITEVHCSWCQKCNNPTTDEDAERIGERLLFVSVISNLVDDFNTSADPTIH
jgi:hypothetical protein